MIKTSYLVLFMILISIGVGTASAMITITLSGNVLVTGDMDVAGELSGPTIEEIQTKLDLYHPDPPPSTGIITFFLDKTFYYPEEFLVFVGHEDQGKKSVFVIVRGPTGNYIGMFSDPASDADGSFSTIPRVVETFFSESGTYTATAFTDDQIETDGVTINLIYTGKKLYQHLPVDYASVSVPAGTSVPGCEETNECFIPYEVTVVVGGEVTWSNDDTAAHTVTSGSAGDGPSGVFDSSLLYAATTFVHTFEAEGEFPYFCMVHPWMEGIVTVR